MLVDGVTVAMSDRQRPPLKSLTWIPGGPSERCRRHHGDDGTRFREVCRGPAQMRAASLLVRRDAAAVRAGAAARDRDVRRARCGAAAAGNLPRLRPDTRAVAGLAAVAPPVRGGGDLRGAGAA